MKIVRVCVGSACYIKGAPEVIARLKEIIEENKLECAVVLKGCFCMQNCSDGVSIDIDGQAFSGLTPDEAEEKFKQIVMGG